MRGLIQAWHIESFGRRVHGERRLGWLVSGFGARYNRFKEV